MKTKQKERGNVNFEEVQRRREANRKLQRTYCNAENQLKPEPRRQANRQRERTHRNIGRIRHISTNESRTLLYVGWIWCFVGWARVHGSTSSC